MMIVMSAVFSTFFVGLRGKNIVNYALYLILGNITFGLMDDATSSPLTSILGSSSLLKKVKIHRTVCPTQKVLFALVNFSFSIKRGETMATRAQPDSSTFQAKQVGDERFAHLPTPGDVVEGQHGHGSFAWQPSTSALRPAFRRCAAA